MNIPSSTYRVQLHKEFPFEKLERIIDYLESLGITTIYAAPIMEATPGSMHGYDVVDPHTINPEIGDITQLKKLSETLRKKGMIWLQDIVPNHMAFHTRNFRLMDVLERGEHSSYYNYFDINWNHHAPHLKGKLQVPVLGEELETCIKNNQVKLGFSENGITVDYYQNSFPLSLSAYEMLASDNTVGLGEFVIKGRTVENVIEWKKQKEELIWAILNNDVKHKAVLGILESINRDKEKLRKILDVQYYVLAFWKDTDREMGYRRFFTVNELICLRMEDETVFDEYHRLFHELYRDGVLHGLRIDHIDGLYDPAEYINRLRKHFGDACYIIAEKILEAKEGMPEHWALQGTSGYEFLSHVSQLFTNRAGAKHLLGFYRDLIPSVKPYEELVLENKKKILDHHMGGEWDNLLQYLVSLDLTGGFDTERMKQALGFVLISLPVYRIYPERLPLEGNDVVILNHAFESALRIGNNVRKELEYLHELFTTSHNEDEAKRILAFLKRFMQFTGPLTAKGVEDTTFYVYNPLISHDEVGDSPSTLGISITNFHSRMAERQKNSALSLNATATHDTKRGEDARIRLNVLCEYPEEWQNLVRQWIEINRRFKKKTSDGKFAPVINDEYFLYQAVLGGFPEDLNVTPEWVERVQSYLTKVVREAKVNSSWANPDEEYEQACHDFIRSILMHDSDFLKTFLPFIKKVIGVAGRYTLGHALIKMTAPGIPDIYQGCELWDLSFVDPDNRRPVDYDKRITYLQQLQEKEKEGNHILFPFLEDHRRDGVEKLFLIWKTLNFRKQKHGLFEMGNYIPLQLTGKDIITVAFARNYKNDWALIVVPLRIKDKPSNPADVLSADEIILPERTPEQWVNIFTSEVIHAQGRLPLSACFTRFPVALFASQE